MNENENNNIEKAKINLNIENENNEVEFQRYITNANDFEKIFLKLFCGYRETQKEKENAISKEYITTYYIDENARICNEACASYLYNEVYTLINHLTTTSNLSEKDITNIWHIKAKMISHNLAYNYFFENNTYEIRDYFYIPSIIQIILSFVPITKKALEGFTLIQSKQIQIMQEYRNPLIESNNQRKSFFDNLKNYFTR